MRSSVVAGIVQIKNLAFDIYRDQFFDPYPIGDGFYIGVPVSRNIVVGNYAHRKFSFLQGLHQARGEGRIFEMSAVIHQHFADFWILPQFIFNRRLGESGDPVTGELIAEGADHVVHLFHPGTAKNQNIVRRIDGNGVETILRRLRVAFVESHLI